MKAPEEIKMGLKACVAGACNSERIKCPYRKENDCTTTVVVDALAYIQELEAKVLNWVSVNERLPKEFISVLAHMTDAGEFPSVREAYVVCGMFLFPALKEVHPVDCWAEMPEPPEEEGV